TRVIFGREGMEEIASMPNHRVLNAVVGIAGLPVTMAAIKAGNTLCLANKESLVTAGALVMKEALENHVEIIPVDSEHSAIFQCLMGEKENKIEKILLTCSGGPFLGKTRKELQSVTIKDTLNHPRWSMGRKITVDSATLMNKGFELIEAMHLFSVSAEQVEILIHPQSVVHSAVEFEDGGIIAQLGAPDMQLPIQFSLTYPKRERMETRLSLSEISTLSFSKPDLETFGTLNLAYSAIEKGGLAPTVLNAANETAVALFLEGKIKFLQIEELLSEVLTELKVSGNMFNIEDIFSADAAARQETLNFFERL
ncbi:MAG: 1-deoxy-D-xylulose-5-phosphate reductoisomerase, partial [Oscillospiraceae bacterium]